MVCEEVKLYKDENVITITEEEVKQYFGDYKNIKELRDISIRYFAKNIQGRTIDIGEYKNIRISRKSREKYESFSMDERKLLIVPKLREIIETSEYKVSSPKYKERKDHIARFYYFTNEVMIKKEIYKVYITIGEDENGKLFYDLDQDENKNKKPIK